MLNRISNYDLDIIRMPQFCACCCSPPAALLPGRGLPRGVGFGDGLGVGLGVALGVAALDSGAAGPWSSPAPI